VSEARGRTLEPSAGTRAGADMPLVFELSRAGRRAFSLPEMDGDGAPAEEVLPEEHRRARPPRLPEVSELELVRHYTRLSQRNWAIDVGPYPLGSCTMKYNPKVAERVAALPGFAALHPLAPDESVPGALELLGELERALCAATGMARLTFQPAAGAQGELTGLLVMRAFHASGGGGERRRVIIPDSAHGTNPASVSLAGYTAQEVRSNERGLVDVDALARALDDDVAGLMLTNPNTLGLFEREIERIAALVHDAGGLLYYDGANFNAIVGKARPGDMGFDIVHLNLHKTFATPHGGGGPGSGPLAVSERLERFLPSPLLVRDGSGAWCWDHDRPDSIGRIHSFHGNFGINVRAYAYLRSLGPEGLRAVAESAVLNANYLRVLIAEALPAAYEGTCMHEFVSSARHLKRHGVRLLDVAKRLIDLGYHPPTVYFPLVVEEALMVEPTETESKETLDGLAAALGQAVAEARSDPDVLHAAPTTTPVRRPDEARAARRLKVRWEPE
jgi:glycine dehydrogenase subunit 2